MTSLPHAASVHASGGRSVWQVAPASNPLIQYRMPGEEWPAYRDVVLLDADAVRIERELNEVLRLVAATLSSSLGELPDVFSLKPLSKQRVTLDVRDRGYAAFSFVSEE